MTTSQAESILDSAIEGTLPFEKERQSAFLGHVMLDSNFFLQVKDRVKDSWFVDGYAGQLYSAYQKFYARYSRIPQSPEEFMAFEELRKLDMAEKLKLRNTAADCRLKSQQYGKDVLTAELTDWMKVRVYHHTVQESAKFFNGRQMNRAVAVLEGAVKEFQTIHFDGQPPADFANARALAKLQELDMEGALTTGISILDRKLNPECKGGSLLKGDTTVLIAPTNIGKTTAMQTIACHNIDACKSVLFITLEGRQHDIMEKFYQIMLRCNKAEFRRMTLSDEPKDVARVDFACQKMNKYLTYISMTKPGLTVEEVVSIIRSHQSRRKAQTGAGYDMLVVDYPAILTTEMAKFGKLELRQSLEIVYRQFVQIALEEKFHALLAAQTNREGSRVNRNTGGEEGRLLTHEDIAEAYAIAMSATNIITVNRDTRAQQGGYLTFYLCKSRSSSVGWAVVCKSDFSKAMTHSNQLGATAYQGSHTMPDRMQKLLTDFNNCDIPIHHV
jgi:replicative DNA helicase